MIESKSFKKFNYVVGTSNTAVCQLAVNATKYLIVREFKLKTKQKCDIIY